VFVADGYGNRRVIVFDADTGMYKRHWGAYGNKPDDKASKERQADGPGPQQFNTPHGIAISRDGIVYVADRANNRVQSFKLDGAFLKEGFVKRQSRDTGTAFGVALSPDPGQRFLYVADGSNERVAILDRASLQEIGHIGGPGRKAGEFFHLHSLSIDPKGNLITGESQGYRVQKFVFKGLSTAVNP
jgi:DNA-binding beta-propeller fold protein YncE